MTENTEMGGRGAKSRTNTGAENKPALTREERFAARPQSFKVGGGTYHEGQDYKVLRLSDGRASITKPYRNAKELSQNTRLTIEGQLNALLKD